MKERDPWFLKRGETKRAWKSKKRKEIKRVKKALDDFRMGCAWVPEYEYVGVIDMAIKALINSMSCRRWGR